MASSREVRQWIARLEAEESRLAGRNRRLGWALAAAFLVLAVAAWAVYRATIGSYAVLDDVAISRHPVNQGRIEVSFRVVTPGKVRYHRLCGAIETEIVDTFEHPGEFRRSWSWPYEPGQDIQVALGCRSGLWSASHGATFPTCQRADIVVLMDTTGSMGRLIAELRDKCTAFSQRLTEQSLAHRFALVGFGDADEGAWLDVHGFTADAGRFRESVARLKRFDGGDLPESALDALEQALTLEFDTDAVRRFYLVTDARFHEPSKSGATAADVARRLADQRVLLYVFSRRQFEADYAPLLGETGRFDEIENFGSVLGEGRVLED